jgi:hypothetical protein
MKDKFTTQEVWRYVEGFMSSQSNSQELSMNEILSMLKNALACIEDGDDGLVAYLDRMEYYKDIQDARECGQHCYFFISGTGGKSIFFDKN